MSSPVVTAPPVIFNAIVPARMDDAGSVYCGPFPIGSNLYAVLISQPVNPAPFHRWLNVYKSTDGGQTWTSLDTGNRPQTNGDCDAILNGAVFTICYGSNAVGNPLKVITFSTSTDTFGTPSVDGPLTNGIARLGEFANGDLCVWYGGFTLGIQQAVIFSGAAWGVPVNIPNAKNSAATIIMGTNDIAQLFYYDLNPPGLNVFFRTFDHTSTLGAEQAVFSSTAPNPNLGLPVGKVALWNGNFILPAYGGVNNNQAGIWTGSPFTAPVWTFTLVNTIAQGAQPAGDTDAFAFTDHSNNLILFWITLNSVPVPAINQMSYAINAGAGFAPQVLFSDETAFPQIVDPVAAGNVLHTLSATRYANGTFGVVTAIDLTVPLPPPCAGFFLAARAAAGTVTACQLIFACAVPDPDALQEYAPLLNPQLDSMYADYWGEFLPFALESWWPIIQAGCYIPRWFQAPTNALAELSVGAYLDFVLTIPPGSFILAILHTAHNTSFNVQITDVVLDHKWFSNPTPDSLFLKAPSETGRNGHVLPKPYPVTWPGHFRVEFWRQA